MLNIEEKLNKDIEEDEDEYYVNYHDDDYDWKKDNGKDQGSKYSALDFILFNLIEDDNKEDIKLMLEKFPWLSGWDETESLQHAICTMDIELMKIMLDGGYDVDKKLEYECESCQTCLMVATRYEDGIEMMQFLLDRGADINHKGYGYYHDDSPLITSIRNRRENKYKTSIFLLEKNAKFGEDEMKELIDDEYPSYCRKNEHIEHGEGFYDFLKILLQKIDKDLLKTFINKVCESKDIETFKFLYENNVNINDIDVDKDSLKTFINNVYETQDIETFKFLYKNNINLLNVDIEFFTEIVPDMLHIIIEDDNFNDFIIHNKDYIDDFSDSYVIQFMKTYL